MICNNYQWLLINPVYIRRDIFVRLNLLYDEQLKIGPANKKENVGL